MRLIPAVLCAVSILCQLWPAAHAQRPIVPPLPSGWPTEAGAVRTGPDGSAFVPVDNWIYGALDRLHALGYVDTAYLGLRPWTRLSIAHMLERSADRITSDKNNETARTIYFAILREVRPEIDRTTSPEKPHVELESVYTVMRGIGGLPLRDSYHLGQSIVNDYGRPYENGFNSYSGFSARAEAGRFSLYWRGEFQHAPSAAGYSAALAALLSNTVDGIPFATNPHQATIPEGPIAEANDMRVMEANLSFHLLGHEISFGKDDHWLGPDTGASMLWSDNAEDIYDFEINRVEPLDIPLLSRSDRALPLRLLCGQPEGPHISQRSMGAHGEDQFQADAQSGVRV